jgi:hypothetical protein
MVSGTSRRAGGAAARCRRSTSAAGGGPGTSTLIDQSDDAMLGLMTTTAAELSSLATALDELTHRITAHAEAAGAAKDEETASELFAIERSLTTANRRLARLAVAMGRQSA